MIGFKLDESMAGYHTAPWAGDGKFKKPMRFTVTWGNKNIFRFLNPFSKEFLLNEARGTITVDGLVSKADCSGSLHLLYFKQKKIRYLLNFEDDNGNRYRYEGEKTNIRPWNIYKTHFICDGVVKDLESNTIISRSTVKFPYSQILTLILSFRIRFRSVFKY